MISCKECREKLYPEDPSIPVGRYHHSTCDYFCNKPTYYRDLEQAMTNPQEVTHIVRHSNMGKKEFNLLQQTANELKHHIESHSVAKKPPPQGYRNIKG